MSDGWETDEGEIAHAKIKWGAIITVVILSLAGLITAVALMGNTPVTWAIACGQNSPTCTTSDASYSRGNTTCHCEKAP